MQIFKKENVTYYEKRDKWIDKISLHQSQEPKGKSNQLISLYKLYYRNNLNKRLIREIEALNGQNST